MKKQIGLLILGFTMLTSMLTAQESMLFKQSVHPNAIYKSTMQTIVDSETIFTSERSAGMEPISANGLTLAFYTVSSGEMEGDRISAIMEYDSMVTQQTTGMSSEPMEMVLLKGAKIYGDFDKKGVFSLDSIVGDLDVNMKNTMEQTVEQFSQNISFPEREMKIGDDFFQEVPLTIPIPGKSPLEMTIKTDYTLKEINEGFAYFDLIQEYIMESEIDELGDMKMTGEGTGKLVFDIKNNYSKVVETDAKVEFMMKIGETSVVSKSDTKTKIETQFSKK